ncbi:hypothetical protein QBC33DRAFT_445317 [Phialemonium atrogriseum]|uniref:TeaA receptor TeaR n=1 Tax=Phialemonium atrogriseum TaxID=1093897 RepID=A0AAJ0FPZ7_9PEZI|nr:uncharacterized protein QBC33DRAFT_445317 [Phialemonium atrogriseum]KAK1770699.1 hypothetical protein QBC33DRAFT_445317 [Phialemonium atrogriseum]
MASMSAIPNATTLTPPSSSHGTGYSWDISSSAHIESRSIKEASSLADGLVDVYSTNQSELVGDSHKRTVNEVYGNEPIDENSKWIHRDKLARIENEELQAAGIILPRAPRAQSKSQNRPRRDPSQDKVNGRTKIATGSIDQTTPRSRKNSETPTDPHTPLAVSVPSWDFRLPEEIAAEANGYFASNGSAKGVSRIPVAKLSPVPIPPEHLERGTPMIRKKDGSPGEEDSINYPKPRSRSGSLGNALASGTNLPAAQPAKRSATDGSPKKGASTAVGRKASGPGKAVNGAAGRPKTRGGPSKDSTSSGTATTRPSTRSGELNKQPEGDPPWLVSAYRPDPRLPPDQQLLPTVAKRLQQEKWEREGKFGNIYDREFRPLNDEGFVDPPVLADEDPASKEAEAEAEEKQTGENWPLRPEPPSPPQPLGRTGSYTTIPKITDKPSLSPLPSPGPMNPISQRPRSSISRAPEMPEDPSEKKGGGCGCCIVM